jgi:hypothetical protein
MTILSYLLPLSLQLKNSNCKDLAILHHSLLLTISLLIQRKDLLIKQSNNFYNLLQCLLSLHRDLTNHLLTLEKKETLTMGMKMVVHAKISNAKTLKLFKKCKRRNF